MRHLVHSLRTPRQEFAVYDGQDFLGIAYEDWDGKFRARTPDDEPVGPSSFKTMTEAMRAFSAVVRK